MKPEPVRGRTLLLWVSALLWGLTVTISIGSLAKRIAAIEGRAQVEWVP